MVYVWIGIIIATAVLEAFTAGLTSIWFTAGGVVGLVFALVGLPTWSQFLAFILASGVLLVMTRKLFLNSMNSKVEKTNVDSVPGTEGVVTEDIRPVDGTGQVKIKGQIWSARPADDRSFIPAGTKISVVRIEGVKAVVTPIADESDDGVI